MATIPAARRAALVLGLLATIPIAACDLDVINPQVIDADTFDPTEDAATLSLSAQTNLYNAFGTTVLRGGYFTGELWVGAVRQETNDFGRRVITSANIDINPSLWAPLSLAISSADAVVEVLDAAPDAATNIHLARSAMNAGLGLVLMSEHFCNGVIAVGPLLTPEQTLEQALSRLERAIAVAGASTNAEAPKILNAARVGAARVHLQLGDLAAAIDLAEDVPADFVYAAIHVDDPGNRGRAGNTVYGSTAGQIVVVPEAYRALDDPRIPFLDLGTVAQDGQLDLVVQTKYDSYGDDITIVSGLEARYIVAEAELKQNDDAAALALIAERRAVGGQDAFTGTGQAAVLAELMDQRARDFWLEGKHTGDYRRNPTATPYVPPEGTAYYKPGQGEFGSLTCIPVPDVERDANPNID